MKTFKLVSICLILGLILLLGSCDFFGISIEDRIADFNSDLAAAQYADLKRHFDDSVAIKDQMDAVYWDTTPFRLAFSPEPIQVVNTVGTTVTATMTNAGGVQNLTLTFVKVGFDYYITKIADDLGWDTNP